MTTDEKSERIREAAAILCGVVYGLLYLLYRHADGRIIQQAELAAVQGMSILDDAVGAD